MFTFVYGVRRTGYHNKDWLGCRFRSIGHESNDTTVYVSLDPAAVALVGHHEAARVACIGNASTPGHAQQAVRVARAGVLHPRARSIRLKAPSTPHDGLQLPNL